MIIEEVIQIVEKMDTQLRTELLKKDGQLQDKKLWEYTYIKHQIDKRKKGGSFSINDHIRAIVYSMLSSGISWERTESGIDIETGRILPIDEIFHQYDPDYLLQCNPDTLADHVKQLGCASQSTYKQMNALINVNILKLIKFEKEYGSVDGYYQKFIEEDSSLKILIKTLSTLGSKDKLIEMGEALTVEYLRNVGYDIAKPDRHIRRILGSNRLACSKHETVPIFDAIDIVKEIADRSEKCAAEVDYILWSYCANGYGNICTVNKPKCDKCVANNLCKAKSIIQENN